MRPIRHVSPNAIGALPLHRQVSEALARDIRAGILANGVCLKPERTMAKEWDISIGTLRKALSHLEALGLLQRIQGSGNYIRYSGSETSVQNIYSLFRLELKDGGGGLPTAEIVQATRLPKPERLARLSGGNTTYHIRRLRRLNGQPAAVEEIWVDGDRSRGLRTSQLSEALYKLYETKLGFTIAHVEDRIGQSMPPAWRPEDFGPTQQAWPVVERWSFDTSGVAAEYSQNWFNPETTTYTARWQAAKS